MTGSSWRQELWVSAVFLRVLGAGDEVREIAASDDFAACLLALDTFEIVRAVCAEIAAAFGSGQQRTFLVSK